jgi:hypothetical protein
LVIAKHTTPNNQVQQEIGDKFSDLIDAKVDMTLSIGASALVNIVDRSTKIYFVNGYAMLCAITNKKQISKVEKLNSCKNKFSFSIGHLFVV